MKNEKLKQKELSLEFEPRNCKGFEYTEREVPNREANSA